MIFKIENGTNLCSIGVSEIGSYFRFQYPITTVWYDCGGSVAKYFCTLPYNETYRKSVEQRIADGLENDYSDNIEGLFEILEPLFPVFKNGEYRLSFYSNIQQEFFQYWTSLDDGKNVHYYPLEVLFAHHITDISNIENLEYEHKEFLRKNAISKRYYASNILDYSTSIIYPGHESFYATQPFDEIDQSRVKYFEEVIKNGKRPFAILFNAHIYPDDYSSAYYILDGHHKLLAYKNLGLYPPLVILTHHPKDNEMEFNVEVLAKVLYPFQIQHILKNWDEKDDYIERTLKNPDSNLHSFIKNGHYEEHYDNGQLKHKAFYINDKVDGSSMYWYENGQIKQEHFFKKGIRSGIWKDYHESGNISYIQPFNEAGQYHGHLISFYENGQKRWEQFLKNGKNKDGISHKNWFKNGKKESELTYKKGRIIVRKNWSILGKVTNHEVLNIETNKLEQYRS
ncbi:MAG: hypothetical protein AB8G22_23675 [Saprospiraceae bacterium]